MIQCFIMEDQQIRETVRKSIPCLYYGKSGDILQEEKYFLQNYKCKLQRKSGGAIINLVNRKKPC